MLLIDLEKDYPLPKGRGLLIKDKNRSAYLTTKTNRPKPKISPIKVEKGPASAYTLTSNKFTSASFVKK